METCYLCERDTSQYKAKCHYLNCPFRNKAKPMPVKVKEPDLPKLIVVTKRADLTGYTAYEDLFKSWEYLRPDTVINKDDVLFFDGGTDINPKLYGEKPHIMTGKPDTMRDEWEIKAFKRGMEAGARFLGTCRGAQLLQVLSGGKLFQHVTGHYNGGHMICTSDGEVMWSESSHHQVMCPYDIDHILLAWGNVNGQQPFVLSDEYGKSFEDDRTPEIVYCKKTRALCIQGHAEWSEKTGPFYKFCRNLVKEFLIEGE